MHCNIQSITEYAVALYMGAWIETSRLAVSKMLVCVALYMGAWIETQRKTNRMNYKIVALYMGAWIETSIR